MTRAFLLVALALGGCMAPNGATGTPPPPDAPADQPGLTYGRLGQDIRVGGLAVRPLRVTEDSRCPANVVCVWAGRVVLVVRVSGVSGERVVSTMEPLRLPDGAVLELASVWPPRQVPENPLRPYRFGFRVTR